MPSKLQEELVFKWFIGRADLNCTVLEIDRESPDFIVDIDGVRTGIEVTQVFADSTSNSKQSLMKRIESENSKWLLRLSKEYYEHNSVPISLSIILRKRPNKLDDLTEAIFDSLNSCQLACWEERTLTVEHHPCELSVIRMSSDHPCYDRWQIVDDHVAFAPAISVDHFERAVTTKTAKIPTYLESCNRIWLLAVADATWGSGRFDVQGSKVKLETQFDELWFANFPWNVERLTS